MTRELGVCSVRLDVTRCVQGHRRIPYRAWAAGVAQWAGCWPGVCEACILSCSYSLSLDSVCWMALCPFNAHKLEVLEGSGKGPILMATCLLSDQVSNFLASKHLHRASCSHFLVREIPLAPPSSCRCLEADGFTSPPYTGPRGHLSDCMSPLAVLTVRFVSEVRRSL
jgi:hypothetical protein